MGLTQAQQRILELVGRLSADDAAAVEKFAEFLAADPVLLAALRAPYADEPLTPEEHEALREADEQIQRGEPFITQHEVLKEVSSRIQS